MTLLFLALGSIGLVTALLLAKRNLNIAIIDPKPADIITKVDDTRNIALMQSSLNVFEIFEYI